MANSSLKMALARYMDLNAFSEGVPDRIKFTSKPMGKIDHDKRKARREIALKRADCAIRFFAKPENREWLDNHLAVKAAATEQAPEHPALAGPTHSTPGVVGPSIPKDTTNV